MLPFLAFCLEVIEELIVFHEGEEPDLDPRPITVLSSGSSVIHPEKLSMDPQKKEKKRSKRWMVQFLARKVLPMFTFIFIFVYTIVCMYSYSNPVLEYD